MTAIRGRYDHLDIVNGSATLGGRLAVSMIDPMGGTNVFQPQAGNTFEILTATGGLGGTEFTAEVLPTLSGGLFFDVLYNSNDVTLVVAGISGDYNRNGVVDAADYVVWRKTLGQSGTGLAADGTGPLGTPDGLVNQLDYQFWRSHFGQTAGSGASVAATSASDAIPEPASLVLLALACCVTFLWQERRRRRNAPCGICCHLMVLSALIFGASICPARAGVVYDAADGFSATNNPHGSWSYGWYTSPTSEFHVYPTPATGSGLNSWYDPAITVLGAPAVGHNPTVNTITSGTVSILAGQLVFHPGNLGQFSVVRWLASMDGSINIEATFTGRDLWGTTTDVHVLHNGASLFDGIVNGFATGPPSFETTRTVLAGDTVDFSVGYWNGSFWNDTTSLDAVIETAPAQPGDFNGDGVVGAADYVVWRENPGGIYIPDDYNTWRTNFGEPSPGSDAGAHVAESLRDSEMAVSERLPNDDAIPEPATLWLLVIVGGLLRFRSRVRPRVPWLPLWKFHPGYSHVRGGVPCDRP